MKNNKIYINFILLGGLALIWGLQFAFNSIALESITPEILATSRITIGSLTLCILMILFESKEAKKTHHKIKLTKSIALRYIAIAFLETIIPMTAIAWGQQYVDSSITGILMGTIPLFVVLLAIFFIPSEKATTLIALSIILGFIGLIILMSPTLSLGHSNSLLGEISILFGALCFASSLIIIRTMPSTSPIRFTRNVLIISAIPLLLYTLIIEPNAYLNFNIKTLSATIILGIFPSGIAYLLYVKLIERAGVTYTSFVNYLAPLVSAFAGVLFMGDYLYLSTFIALFIILAALLLNNLPQLVKRKLPIAAKA